MEALSSYKQEGPDFRMRLGAEKEEWQKAAIAEGEPKLNTWVKKIVRAHIAKSAKRKSPPR